MRTRGARLVLAFDLRCALRSARGILFLVFYGLTTWWFLSKLAEHRESIEAFARPSGMKRAAALRLVAMLIGDDGTLVRLLSAHPPILVFYAQFALITLPLFVMTGAFDQTATDLSTRHLRFLLLKTTRASVFAGRLAGAYVLVATPPAIVTLAWGIASGDAAWGARVALAVAALALPLVALLALLNAATASAAITLLAVTSWQLVVWLASTVLAIADERFASLAYLFPTAIEPMLLDPSPARFALGLGAALGYAAAFAAAGWWIFRRRDV
ncbi:MAG: hypothetical protein AABZ30_03105 [Myxococcota bacterium]